EQSTNLAAMFKRLLIWVLLLAAWEGAYRVIGCRPWIFPAPSHVLDSLLGMLNVPTAVGEQLHSGWPWVQSSAQTRHIYSSPSILANLISASQLAIGFAISILQGGLIGMAMRRWPALNDFLGPLLLGLQTLPSVCWVPLAVLTFGLNERGIMFVLVMG